MPGYAARMPKPGESGSGIGLGITCSTLVTCESMALLSTCQACKKLVVPCTAMKKLLSQKCCIFNRMYTD